MISISAPVPVEEIYIEHWQFGMLLCAVVSSDGNYLLQAENQERAPALSFAIVTAAVQLLPRYLSRYKRQTVLQCCLCSLTSVFAPIKNTRKSFHI
jgi:hypothetical protein